MDLGRGPQRSLPPPCPSPACRWAKSNTLADLLGPLLADYVHVAGIVVSNAARRRLPLPKDEDALRPTAQSFLRGLPLDRVRETIVIGSRANLGANGARACQLQPAGAEGAGWIGEVDAGAVAGVECGSSGLWI